MEFVYQGDCRIVLRELIDKNITVDGVITSPFYNLGKNPFHWKKGEGKEALYDEFSDNLTEQNYLDFMLEIFKLYEQIVNEDGVILFIMSYSSKNAILPILLMNKIHESTAFTLREQISWKKTHAIPFQTSPNNLSRICETVYVIARKNITYTANKKVTKINERTNQKFYGTIYNFVEAKNSDSHKGIRHNATYSTELVGKLLDIYFPKKTMILDNFMGLGTTGVATIINNRNFIGIELVPAYFQYAKTLIERTRDAKS